MNAYDQKHLDLLRLVHDGKWQEIPEHDVQDLQVLVACKYVVIRTQQDVLSQITLEPEGRTYLQALALREQVAV